MNLYISFFQACAQAVSLWMLKFHMNPGSLVFFPLRFMGGLDNVICRMDTSHSNIALYRLERDVRLRARQGQGVGNVQGMEGRREVRAGGSSSLIPGGELGGN